MAWMNARGERYPSRLWGFDIPGCIVSDTTASFCSVVKRRRRATPVITSTFEKVEDIGVCLGLRLKPVSGRNGEHLNPLGFDPTPPPRPNIETGIVVQSRPSSAVTGVHDETQSGCQSPCNWHSATDMLHRSTSARLDGASAC